MLLEYRNCKECQEARLELGRPITYPSEFQDVVY